MAERVVRPPAEKLVDSSIKVGKRQDTTIDKGVILNETYLQDEESHPYKPYI